MLKLSSDTMFMHALPTHLAKRTPVPRDGREIPHLIYKTPVLYKFNDIAGTKAGTKCTNINVKHLISWLNNYPCWPIKWMNSHLKNYWQTKNTPITPFPRLCSCTETGFRFVTFLEIKKDRTKRSGQSEYGNRTMKTIEAALMLEADLSDELERLGWSPQNLILLLANTVRHMKVPVFLLTSLKRFSVTVPW